MTTMLVASLRCKAGDKAECQREATVVIHAVRSLPATAFGPAQTVPVSVRSCEVHARRISTVGQVVPGIGKIAGTEPM